MRRMAASFPPPIIGGLATAMLLGDTMPWLE
jgi:hypothetical protein